MKQLLDRIRRVQGRDEQGAAAVETSLVIGLLLLLALGAVEYGLVFKEWIAVTSASREGARTAAAAGDNANADCYVLEAAAGPLASIDRDSLMSISIYRTDTAGTRGPANVYRPALPSDDPSALDCDAGYFVVSRGWPSATRDNRGSVRDWVAVEVEFDHDWVSGFLWFDGSVCDRGTAPGVDCWTQNTVMHIEPDPDPF